MSYFYPFGEMDSRSDRERVMELERIAHCYDLSSLSQEQVPSELSYKGQGLMVITPVVESSTVG
jgi:hypothetical protein